ncbi:MAG: hypothetical protein RL494_1776 [Bacteroidota bacterium]|jgi:hypothetical protein
MRLFLFLFFTNLAFAQWTPGNPLINAPADCPIAYRICDVTQSYNFALIDDGLIDDAHGSLGIPGLNRSSLTQFESKSAFIVFTPQYSGQFGLRICPETLEDLAFLLFENPNCNDLETGAYSIVTQGGMIINDPTTACTGIGINPDTGTTGGDWDDYINVIAGNTYKLFVSLEAFSQPGTHRFTLSFLGAVVIAHLDLFNYVGCTMSTNDFIKDNTSVYPNPFTNVLQIKSDTAFKKLELYDVLGKQIISQVFSNQLDTSNLNQGLYFLKLYTEDGEVVVKKVVKE